MTYHCPSCGKRIDGNIFFQTMGQCLCDHCGNELDLTNVTEETTNDSDASEYEADNDQE